MVKIIDPAAGDERNDEIALLRETQTLTRRAISPDLEDILYQQISVLDHGFIRVIDYMGNDGAIVQAARVSYGTGTRKTSEDSGLINYLLSHAHTTPFEMAELKIHVKLPIFVARQWIRHRTASVNEYSARYSIIDNEFYVPESENLAAQSQTNKQGRGNVFSESDATDIKELIRRDAERSYASYLELLNENNGHKNSDGERPGLTRELARINLGVGFYTQWYWKVNLHNLMHFLQLRADPHAQYEIRAYANVLLEIMSKWVPLTYAAFCEHRLKGKKLSNKAVAALQRKIAGESVTLENSGLSKREWQELSATFQFK